MAFTSGDVLDRSKRRLGITDQDDFDTEMYQWMDDLKALLDSFLAQMGYGWGLTTDDYDIVANEDHYPLDAPLYIVDSVFYKQAGSDEYVKLTYDQSILEESDNPTDPRKGVVKWAFEGLNIILRGYPDAASTDGLRVFGYPSPAAGFDSTSNINDINMVRLLHVLYIAKTYRGRQGAQQPEPNAVEFDRVLQNYLDISKKRYGGSQQIEDEMYE